MRSSILDQIGPATSRQAHLRADDLNPINRQGQRYRCSWNTDVQSRDIRLSVFGRRVRFRDSIVFAKAFLLLSLLFAYWASLALENNRNN